MVTFEEVFALYMDQFRGKMLTLICDCSYSGNWVEQCAKKLDEMGIPSCGHHTREQGIFIKIYCSCRDDQQASLLAFCVEAVFVNEKKEMRFCDKKKLKSDQHTVCVPFVEINCHKKPEEACRVPPYHTWMDRSIHSHYVYLVRGEERGRPAWYYILVEKEKVQEFKAQLDAETIDLSKFGKILNSGFGEDPPKQVKEIDRYRKYLKPA